MTFLEFSAKETVKDGSHNKVLQTVAFSSTATISQTVTVVCYYLLLLVKALPQVQQPANSRVRQSLFHLMCSTLYGYQQYIQEFKTTATGKMMSNKG